MLVVVEVEDPDRIRAVIAAVPGADAAVVDLAVQSVGIMIAGIDGAYRLAGRVMAVLAEYRQEAHAHVRVLPHPEPLDPEPVHVTALGDFLLSADGHVVLRLAGDHAGAASSAAVEVHDHSPFVRARQLFHLPKSF